MFNFKEIAANSECVESVTNHGIEDIKTENMSKGDADNFWKDVFKPDYDCEDISLEKVFNDIYGRKIEEFEFDFTIDEEIHSKMDTFQQETWDELTVDEKKTAIKELSDCIADRLGLEELPTIEYFLDDPSNCGYYSPYSNMISLNENTLSDAKEILDTIPHELRHAYQHQRAGLLENYDDLLYKANLDNYIMPIFLDDGSCICFTDYQNQYVEAEARAFANLFK